MKKCPSCKHAVSTKAETCPSCGHPLKKKKRKSGCASTLLMLLILGGFVFYVMMNDDSPEAQHLDKQIDYKITSQRYIRDQLRAPSTAKFPLNAQVYERKGFWIVESYVEAQNGFGAIIRTYYAVAIEQGENSRHIVASEMSEYPIGLARPYSKSNFSRIFS